MGGRSYITVRVLVLIVSCLVVLEYISLLQSAENADKPRPSVFCLVGEERKGHWHRHVLQMVPADLFRPEASMLISSSNLSGATVISYSNSSQTYLYSSTPLNSPRPSNASLAECPMIPPGLEGRFPVTLGDVPDFPAIEAAFPQLERGGRWRPPECNARHKVAIIVPYRDREDHLRTFLLNIHRFLQRQQNEYGIYIVEQSGTGSFNRAMLMNVGAAEAIKQHDYQCFIFHDVDLLPEDDRNLYTCPIQPRHMSVAVDTFSYKLPYDDIFGGVSAMTIEQFRQVNGFSNLFWGWGGEDDDIANRLRTKKLFISRYPANIARYKMLKHGKEKANPERFKYLYSGAKRMAKDGYNSLKYRKVDFQLKKLYTWILVDLPHLKS